MRFHNIPLFRQLNDLKAGLYLKPIENIESEKAFSWIQEQLTQLTRIVSPIVGLLELLTKSFGEPRDPGNINEILHATKLIKQYIEHVLAFEEKIWFIDVPDEYKRAINLLKNLIGSQVLKLASIPFDLDKIASHVESTSKTTEKTTFFKKEIVFDLPDSWEREFSNELNKLKRKQGNSNDSIPGCFTTLIIAIIIVILSSIF